MQPSDNTPTPTPEQPKQGFWAKLFGKKPAAVSLDPPHGSNTPPPRLDEKAPEASAPQPTLDIAQPNVDPILGNKESDSLSAPDQNGEVTSLPVVVPDSIQSPADGHAPSILTSPQSETPQQQSTSEPIAPQSFTQPQTPESVPAVQLPPTQAPQPPQVPPVAPAPQQPPQTPPQQ